MSHEIIHIDTNAPMFKAPPGVESYSAWLEAVYHSSAISGYGEKSFYQGVGQKINSIIYAANHKDAHVITCGPDAAEAAAVLHKLSNGSVDPQIIRGDLS